MNQSWSKFLMACVTCDTALCSKRSHAVSGKCPQSSTVRLSSAAPRRYADVHQSSYKQSQSSLSCLTSQTGHVCVTLKGKKLCFKPVLSLETYIVLCQPIPTLWGITGWYYGQLPAAHNSCQDRSASSYFSDLTHMYVYITFETHYVASAITDGRVSKNRAAHWLQWLVSHSSYSYDRISMWPQVPWWCSESYCTIWQLYCYPAATRSSRFELKSWEVNSFAVKNPSLWNSNASMQGCRLLGWTVTKAVNGSSYSWFALKNTSPPYSSRSCEFLQNSISCFLEWSLHFRDHFIRSSKQLWLCVASWNFQLGVDSRIELVLSLLLRHEKFTVGVYTPAASHCSTFASSWIQSNDVPHVPRLSQAWNVCVAAGSAAASWSVLFVIFHHQLKLLELWCLCDSTRYVWIKTVSRLVQGHFWSG